MNIKDNYFQNPILQGFYPDPSICRVKEDYYLINSSFTFFPGVPIFHSKDLVNWNQIGHVLDRPSQLNLDGSNYTGGIFAPTIRYNNGIFYMITTNVDNGGNFIVTATNPQGPWSEPYWLDNAVGIDPSLFFDGDGKVYYTGTRDHSNKQYLGQQEIWLQELDLKTMTLIGDTFSLWDGALKTAHFVEGPHLYKVGEYYYLLVAEGGTEHYHSVTIARSKNILGPYEANPGNPIITQRHLGKNSKITNIGHADLVETQNGEWYMVALGSRPYGGYYKNLTRETFLIPVIWEDGWPIVSPETGKVEIMYPLPNLPKNETIRLNEKDNFDNDTLSYIWNFYHTPKERFWNLRDRKSYLRLKLTPNNFIEKITLPPYKMKIGPEARKREAMNDCPSFIGRRQQHINFSASTKMEFNPLNENESAGLILTQNNNHHYKFEYTIKNKKKVIRLIKHTADVKIDFHNDNITYKNFMEPLIEKEFDSKDIFLKVEAIGQSYNFYYGESLENLKTLAQNIDGRILCSEVASGCSGTYIGMFASSNGIESTNYADFDWFEYIGN